LPKFKVIISDTGKGTSQSLEIEDAKAQTLLGRRIGEDLDGSLFDMKGKRLQITGGSDKDGVPMRKSVHGGIRIGAILSDRPGFHPRSHGQRRRKMIRGDTITEEISQINMKTIETSNNKKTTEEESENEAAEKDQA